MSNCDRLFQGIHRFTPEHGSLGTTESNGIQVRRVSKPGVPLIKTLAAAKENEMTSLNGMVTNRQRGHIICQVTPSIQQVL